MVKPRSHEENRSVLCILCFTKSKGLRPVTEAQTETIRTYFLVDYNPHFVFYPTGICCTCRIICSQYAIGNFTRTIQVHKYKRSIPLATRKTSQMCSCEICSTARLSIGTSEQTTVKPQRGRPRLTDHVNEPIVASICKRCYTEVGRGKRHVCTKTERVANLSNVLDDGKATASGESVVSSFLNKRMKMGESSVKLRNLRGKPSTFLNAAASESDSAFRVSTEELFQMKADNNLSIRKTLSIAKSFREHGVKFESGFRDKLSVLNRQLKDFFEITSLRSAADNGTTEHVEDTPVVYCTDVPGLIQHIKEKRQIGEALIKIGIDGGGKFFKITLSVIPTNPQHQSKSNQFKDSGVRRIMILAVAPKLAEKYDNIIPIWKNLLKLHELDAVIAGDLKIVNIITGLMAHSSAHPCPYCEADKKKLLEYSGTLRTVGNIRHNYRAWKTARTEPAKKYFNCVNEPLINGSDEQLILTACPPPALHITLGIVNSLFKAVEAINSQCAELWVAKARVRHQQRTYGFTGRACHSLLESCDVLDDFEELHEYLSTLKYFREIHKVCFQDKLHSNIEEVINRFSELWEHLKLPNSSKFHILKHHVRQFCEATSSSLGAYGEQASETVHSDFLITWERYNVPVSSKLYNKQLLSAVIDYNSSHIV